jgi:N-acetylmuramoyl-L-alanine amidase
VPTNYKADVFLALHADGDETGTLSGFKLARARWSMTPDADDKIIAAIVAEYGPITGLEEDPLRVSRNMTGYYSFNWRRGSYSIAPTTPSAILEMAYMTNRSDLNLLLNKPDVIAQGIASGILRYFRETSG